MPRRKHPLKGKPFDFRLPTDRPLRDDELKLGTPKAQEILKAFVTDPKKAWRMFDDLNILQANQFVAFIQALKQQVDAKENLPTNVMDFMLKVGGGIYKETKHTRLIGESLIVAEKPTSPHLWISAPPGHGKSTSVGFWGLLSYMIRHPTRHNGLIMHKYDKAEQRTKRIRNWIRSSGQKYGLVLDETSRAAGSFKLRQGGSLQAYGTSSTITGDRFNGIVLLDDPVKGQEMVRSAEQRDNQWDWFLAEVINRLDPGGKIIAVMTRWHEDDLCGRSLTRMEEVPEAIKFDFLRLPALADDEDDPLARPLGEPLWPERFPLATLTAIRATYTPFMWSSLYQGSPAPDEGVTFSRDWWQFYEKRPERFDVLIQSWDLAFGDLQTSDYTVGIIMGRRGPHIFILDVIREKLSFDKVVELMRATTLRWPLAGGKLIERTANGWAAIAMLSKEVPGIMPIVPKTSKEIRAQAVIPFVQAKNVWLPKAAPWLDGFLSELSHFGGGGKHDDQVDAFTQGLNYLMFGAYASREEAERAALQAKEPTTVEEIYAREFSVRTNALMRREEMRINRGVLPSDSHWNYPDDVIATPGGELVGPF